MNAFLDPSTALSSTTSRQDKPVSYKDPSSLLKQNIRGHDGKIDPKRLLQNLLYLSSSSKSPETITSLWLRSSEILRNNIPDRKKYASLFQDFWNEYGGTIRKYLSKASLKFLSENYKYLSESVFNSDVINRILLERLSMLRATASPQMINDLLRVYRGLRLMPPYELVTQIPVSPIASREEFREYISLLHGISRAGLSVTHTNILDPLKHIPHSLMRRLGDRDRNTLLWSLTSQFAFARDGGMDFHPSILNTYKSIKNHMSKFTNNDHYLRRTFNLASIILEEDITNAQYNDEDTISRSEYKFMHDFREYGLTPDERSNLKQAGIAKHVTNLDRELDGHYMIGNQSMIIEFDGKSHYRESLTGYGDEPNGSTKLQTHILQKLFPDHVIIRLHYKLGNSFTLLPEDQKADAFAKFREYISRLSPDAYYLDLHNGRLRVQTARELQLRHNNENGITRQPIQM